MLKEYRPIFPVYKALLGFLLIYYLEEYNKEQICDNLCSKPLWFAHWSTNSHDYIAAFSKDWSPNPAAFTSLKMLSNSMPSMMLTTTSVIVNKLRSPEKPHSLFPQIYIMQEIEVFPHNISQTVKSIMLRNWRINFYEAHKT